MGGCLGDPKKKVDKVEKGGKFNGKAPVKLPVNRSSIQLELKKNEEIKPKYKKMTINQLLSTYRIENTLNLCSKFEGPKYISNIVTGSSKILRIINPSQINQKRLEVFKNILGFQIYENEQGSLMIFDEYCAGEDIYEAVQNFKSSEDPNSSGAELLLFLQRIFLTIEQFHKNNVWLGNLTLSSFRNISAFANEMRLVDFNLIGPVGEHEKMGFAHKDNFQADYQFLGYLIQFLVCQQPPIFISHKMQYVQFQTVPQTILIQKLIKGNKCTINEINQIKPSQIIVNTRVGYGYKFRRDINKLLKMRKKRKGHNYHFYGQDLKQIVTESKFYQDSIYRLQTERIIQRITSYIDKVTSLQQEPFINYAGNNDNLRKLKEIFLLSGTQKKMNEFRDCLINIK